MRFSSITFAPGIGAIAALFAGCGGSQPPIAPVATVQATASKTKAFYYTGAQQNFTVPPGVRHVTITAIGAPVKSSYGGLVKATIPVAPGESLAVFVGGTAQGYHRWVQRRR